MRSVIRAADQYKEYLKSKDQHKADVGLVLARRFGYVGIVDAIPGSPADNAGLATGDVLESINGVSTRDMPLAFGEMLLEGNPGTTVEVGVLRFRKPEPQKITLTRETVHYPAVKSHMAQDDVGVIQVGSLVDGEVQQVAKQVESLQNRAPSALFSICGTAPRARPSKAWNWRIYSSTKG